LLSLSSFEKKGRSDKDPAGPDKNLS